MRKLFSILGIFVILFSACTGGWGQKWNIGIDPTFYPADLANQSDKVYGFTLDLLKEIASLEEIPLNSVSSGSESLFSGLQRGGFRGVIAARTPKSCEIENYACSDPYILTGPVIVTTVGSPIRSLQDFNGKLVGVLAKSEALLLVQANSKEMIRTFNGYSELMQALASASVDVAVVDNLVAKTYCQNSYQGMLQVASAPLNNEGLRLVVLQNQPLPLVPKFNRALKKMQEEGTFQKLVTKWQILI